MIFVQLFRPCASSCEVGLLASAAGAALIATTAPSFAQAVESVTVTAERLAAARNGIQTQTGASTYIITSQDIDNQPAARTPPSTR